MTERVSGGILVEVPAETPRPDDQLLRLAAPWTTRRQLRRLERRRDPSADTVRFAVLGDCEPSRFWIMRKLFNREGVFSRNLQAVQREPISFLVQLGDMVEKGEPHRFTAFFEGLRRHWPARIPYLSVLGNHDRSRPNGKSHSRLYRALMGRPNYYFDHSGTRFVVLDSSAKKLRSSHLRWLKLVLAVPGRKIIFTHMPPVQLGLWGGRGTLHALGGFVDGASRFARLVSEAGVSRVYMGHVHAFGVQDYLGVRYVLTGGGGSALFPSGNGDRFHHYITVESGPDGLREQVHALDGRVFAIPSAPVILSPTDPRPLRVVAREAGAALVRGLAT